jgi:hypothetical protein
MALRVADDVLDSGVDAIVGRIDQGSGANGTIEFYTGSRPASVHDSPTGIHLATVAYQNPAFGASSGTTASANGTPLTTTGLTDGTIGWCRILDADGNPLWDDFDIGTSASNAITVNTTTVSENVDFELVSHDFGMDDKS